MGKALNLSHIEILGDNKFVILLCASENDPPWDCAPIIEDIRVLVSYNRLSFRWYPRSANGAGH
ncbi:hypothetical protein ACSBR1_004456 [Camellia fascicularis]